MVWHGTTLPRAIRGCKYKGYGTCDARIRVLTRDFSLGKRIKSDLSLFTDYSPCSKMKACSLLLVGAVSVNALTISQSARCGEDYGTTCLNSQFGNCCSQYGWWYVGFWFRSVILSDKTTAAPRRTIAAQVVGPSTANVPRRVSLLLLHRCHHQKPRSL